MRVRWRGGRHNVRKGAARRQARVKNEFLDGDDLLAVAVFLKLAQQRLNLIDESLLFGALKLGEDLLDNIVAILITHQAKQWTFSSLIGQCERGDNVPTLRLLTKLDTLLNHVTGKLVFREHEKLRNHNDDHARTVLLLPILNHVLDDVIAKLVWDEVGRASVQFTKDRLPVFLLAMFEHALDNPASVRVRCKSADLTLERVDDELYVLRRDPLNGLLNDMVAVLVAHAFQHVVFQFLYHRCLLVGKNMFESLYKLACCLYCHGRLLTF